MDAKQFTPQKQQIIFNDYFPPSVQSLIVRRRTPQVQQPTTFEKITNRLHSKQMKETRQTLLPQPSN